MIPKFCQNLDLHRFYWMSTRKTWVLSHIGCGIIHQSSSFAFPLLFSLPGEQCWLQCAEKLHAMHNWRFGWFYKHFCQSCFHHYKASHAFFNSKQRYWCENLHTLPLQNTHTCSQKPRNLLSFVFITQKCIKSSPIPSFSFYFCFRVCGQCVLCGGLAPSE